MFFARFGFGDFRRGRDPLLMKFILAFIGWLLLGLVAGVVQGSLVAPVPLLMPFDVVMVGALWLLLTSRTQFAFVYGLAGTVTIDTISGWSTPVHTVVFLIALVVFMLLSRRVFSSQTAPSMALNAAIAVGLNMAGRALASGVAPLTLPGQITTLGSSFTLLIVRMIAAATIIWFVQVFRRRSYTTLSPFRS